MLSGGFDDTQDDQTAAEAIIEGISDPFYVLDHEWRFIYLNSYLEKMAGKTRQELMGKSIWEVFPETVTSRTFEEMQRAISEQRTINYESYAPILGQWIEVNLYPNKLGLSVYFRNIDKRVSARQAAEIAQAALDAERQRIVDIFNSISEAFCTLDTDYRFDYLNPPAIDLFQRVMHVTPEQVVGTKVWDLIPGVYDTPFGRAYRTTMETGESSYVTSHFEPLGVWIELRVYRSNTGLSVYFRDVTQQQQTQKVLEETQKELKAVFDQAAVGIVATLPDGQLLYANPGFCRMLGYISEEIPTLSIKEVTHPDDYEADISQINRVVAGEIDTYTLVKRYVRKDQSLLWAKLTSSAIRREDGSAQYAIGIVDDISQQKEAEEEARLVQLELDAERQRVIDNFESIQDAFATLDNELRYTYLNRKGREVTEKVSGVPAEELIGKSAFEIVPALRENPIGQAMLRALNEQIPTTVEAYFPPLQTTYSIRVYPSVHGVSAYFADVTEQYNMRLALREAENQLQLIIDSAKDYAIFSTDQEGVVTTWNSGAERAFGYTASEIIGHAASMIYTPEDRATGVPQQEMRKAAEVGYAEDERWHLRKNGSRFYASGMVRPIRTEDGALRGFTKVARDVTDQQLAEQRTEILQQLAAELSTYLTTQEMPESILNAVRTAFGESLIALFSVSPDRKTLDRLVTRDGVGTIEDGYLRLPMTLDIIGVNVVLGKQIIAFPTQQDYIQHYPHFETDIRALDVHSAICVPMMVQDEVTGVLYASFTYPREFSKQDRDLLMAIAQLCAVALQRASLFEAERQARQVAEQANALKMQFLGMISHELRTPLASIKGFTSTLLAKDVSFPPETQQQFLGIVEEETDKLTNLVGQLLDLSRLQSGTLRIDLMAQPFSAILNVANTQLRTLTAEHHLQFEIADGLPMVLADTHRIAQVLVNLAGNAVKFSPLQTTIQIVASTVAQNGGQIVQIDVRDQGVGIPPEERDKVFEAFRQVERKDASTRLGAGLGLAICKSIIDAHGGRIWIQDQQVGTTISFTLPSAETPPDLNMEQVIDHVNDRS